MNRNNKTTLVEGVIDAARLEINLAHEALKVEKRNEAWEYLHQALTRLSEQTLDSEGSALFVSTVLRFSSLCLALGKGFIESIILLQAARSTAQRLTDRRSLAIIKLHLARLLYFADRRSEAMELFDQGRIEVESIGDEDILNQAAEFIGMYYFLQGLFTDAMPFFQRATQSFESVEIKQIILPLGPMWLSYCAAYLGQFHKAIGTIDYYRRLALDRSENSLATTLRTTLGFILLLIRKKREAFFHFSGALQDAVNTNNLLAIYFSKLGMAYFHFLEGQFIESRKYFAETIIAGEAAGIILQLHYVSDILIETIFTLDRQGIDLIPGFRFDKELTAILQEPNIHLRGVGLRLKAMRAEAKGADSDSVMSDLKLSEECLIQSGNPIQLAKTWIEMARLKLRQGDYEAAKFLAQKAWKGFSGYDDIYYPDDLRHLLTVKSEVITEPEMQEKYLMLFVDIIGDLSPGQDLNRILNQTVVATNRFFGAERGGIFWFNQRINTKNPELRASCNLLKTDAADKDFRPSLALISKAFSENKPQVIRRLNAGVETNKTRAMLCVPFKLRGDVQGVLYHDNSYVKDCFEFLDNTALVKMAHYLTIYIEHLVGLSHRLEEKISAHLNRLGQVNIPDIQTQSPIMVELLNQADRLAATDSTVLILGETGVGKELISKRLHMNSQRQEKPFVVIDPTTIPEALFESELFGHEKGAFTGAERQKQGRIELAHRGTLFIDEVGEIPKFIQTKLLRVLQEKTFTRVGGTETLFSDFRLIAATNRDLAADVAAGRFREDLFYRLSVIPLKIPPLRERADDIPLLARYFLKKFSVKHNRSELHLTHADEVNLMAYEWPGNVRELENVMERAVLVTLDDKLDLDLPIRGESIVNSMSDFPGLDEIQRRYIYLVLKKTKGKISGPGGAAEMLGMKRTTLNNRMKKLGILSNLKKQILY
jgi:transcriptional regulator with GAF, ATPase, and Fis domain